MSAPLNPQLYNALVKAFGDVHIANEGEPYIPSLAIYRGRRSSPPAHAGEYYCVSCPYCDDTRKRLWINHMWGVATDNDDHLYLAWCFLCGSISTRDVQKDLYERVFPFNYGRRVRRSELAHQPQHCEAPPVITAAVGLPPGLFSLDDDVAARAAAYLRGRGFDPAELEQTWGVKYCIIAPNVQPRIVDRIVIPIYGLRPSLQLHCPSETVLVGWQSRHIGNDVPQGYGKYMTMQGLKKSNLLYGLPQAVATRGPLVIVEGVTDVWRLQHSAVASLGKHISTTQQHLLVRYFSGRPIVLFFDRGTTAEAQHAVSDIRAIRRKFGDLSPVVIATPPAGRDDVGECTREEAWAAVHAALEFSR